MSTTTTRPTTRRATERAVGRALADAGLEGVVSAHPSDGGRFETMVSETSASAAAELTARLPWATVVKLDGQIFVV